MRYITTPEALEMSGSKFSFAMFVRWLVDNDERFNMAGPGIRMGARILEAVRDDIAKLADDDWKMLAEAAENPTVKGQPIGYPITPARGILPFVEAIAQAADEDPRKQLAAAE